MSDRASAGLPDNPPACRAILWLRDDLRTDDHPALVEALTLARRQQGGVVALYVLDDALWNRPPGAASRWWLHHSLKSQEQALASLGIPLLLARGDCVQAITSLAGQCRQRFGLSPAVLWNQGQTPFLRAAEQRLVAALPTGSTVPCRSELLVEPGAIRAGSGQPYRVFTPFWKSLQASHWPSPPLEGPSPLPAHLQEGCRLLSAPEMTGTESGVYPGQSGDRISFRQILDSWQLLPVAPDWAGGLRRSWTPGEASALARMQAFIEEGVADYPARRDLPAEDGTSRLSPHLKFGEISPRRLWAALTTLTGDRATAFLRELAWREFNHHLLFQAPDLASRPLRPEFEAFPWREDPSALRQWQRGQTGYPLVDAGMRQLWETGWMHNRVRMVVASFLVKDLLIPWQAGEQWFHDTLVDACPANNPGNWQWTAGCGSDAAPWFRIFNPLLQGEKFDPDGSYARHWLPALAGSRQPHRLAPARGNKGSSSTKPRPAPGADLFAPLPAPQPAGISSYPPPVVDHGMARERALKAFASLSGASEDDSEISPG